MQGRILRHVSRLEPITWLCRIEPRELVGVLQPRQIRIAPPNLRQAALTETLSPRPETAVHCGRVGHAQPGCRESCNQKLVTAQLFARNCAPAWSSADQTVLVPRKPRMPATQAPPANTSSLHGSDEQPLVRLGQTRGSSRTGQQRPTVGLRILLHPNCCGSRFRADFLQPALERGSTLVTPQSGDEWTSR